jgi:hypothetical protein
MLQCRMRLNVLTRLIVLVHKTTYWHHTRLPSPELQGFGRWQIGARQRRCVRHSTFLLAGFGELVVSGARHNVTKARNPRRTCRGYCMAWHTGEAVVPREQGCTRVCSEAHGTARCSGEAAGANETIARTLHKVAQGTAWCTAETSAASLRAGGSLHKAIT